MLQVPRDIQVAFDRKIEEALVRREERPTYRKCPSHGFWPIGLSLELLHHFPL